MPYTAGLEELHNDPDPRFRGMADVLAERLADRTRSMNRTLANLPTTGGEQPHSASEELPEKNGRRT